MLETRNGSSLSTWTIPSRSLIASSGSALSWFQFRFTVTLKSNSDDDLDGSARQFCSMKNGQMSQIGKGSGIEFGELVAL